MKFRSKRYFRIKKKFPNGVGAWSDKRWKGDYYGATPPVIPPYSIRHKSKRYLVRPIEYWHPTNPVTGYTLQFPTIFGTLKKKNLFFKKIQKI